MQLMQRFVLSSVLVASFVCAQDADDIFDKPVLSRVTRDNVAESCDQFKAQFARANNIERVLKYAVLPAAVACSTYLLKDQIYKTSVDIGDTVVGTGQWVYSGAGSAARLICSPFTSKVVENGVEQVVEIAAAGAEQVVEAAADIVPQLTDAEIIKWRASLPYIETLEHSLFERTRLWFTTRVSLVTGFTSVLLNVLGKDYAVAQLSRVTGTQNLMHFIQGSTAIASIKADLTRRQQDVRNPLGRSSIEHLRERVYELCERLQVDVVRIVGFMQALNEYNQFAIGSISSQAHMLMDEANDLATMLEYKLDEFDHTADLDKRQELLKEMLTKSLRFISMLETEVNSFSILINQV